MTGFTVTSYLWLAGKAGIFSFGCHRRLNTQQILMNIKQFDLRDLPTLIRYRNKGLFFNNASLLTRGEILVPTGALFSYFAPATGIFTYLCMDNQSGVEPLLGQVTHGQGEEFAHLSFIAPEALFETGPLLPLLEHIVQQVGKRGAFHLLAEVEERTAAFDNLREAGFALYVHQRIWKFSAGDTTSRDPSLWQEISSQDAIAVRTLYNTLVPALIQQVESVPSNPINGLVYYQDDELLAYAAIKYGQRGIWVQPFIHPETDKVPERIDDLIQNIPNRHGRPIFLCIRSYQSWVEHALEDMNSEVGPNQAVMVKHLAVTKKVRNSFTLPALEGGQQEITTPFTHSEINKQL